VVFGLAAGAFHVMLVLRPGGQVVAAGAAT
jgi:hypothetical protein